jgi:hypothetical protein
MALMSFALSITLPPPTAITTSTACASGTAASMLSIVGFGTTPV